MHARAGRRAVPPDVKGFDPLSSTVEAFAEKEVTQSRFAADDPVEDTVTRERTQSAAPAVTPRTSSVALNDPVGQGSTATVTQHKNQDALQAPIPPVVVQRSSEQERLTHPSVLELRNKLQLLNEEEQTIFARCSELLAKPPQSATEQFRAYLNDCERKQLTMTAQILEAKRRASSEVELALKQRAENIDKITSEARQTRTDAARSQLRELQRRLDESENVLNALRRDVEDQLRSATGSAPSAEERVSVQLAQKLHSLLASWRATAETRYEGVLREAIRIRLAELNNIHQDISDSARLNRQAALRKHQQQRHESFENFRKSKHDAHRHSSDAFLDSLKRARERHVSEVIAVTTAVATRHEKELEEATALGRAQTKALVERKAAQQRSLIQEEWLNFEQQFRNREAALREEEIHKKKIMERDREAALRRNASECETQKEESARMIKKSLTSFLRGELQQQRVRIKDLHDRALVAEKGVEASRKMPSSCKSSLIQRESALSAVKYAATVKIGTLNHQWTSVMSSIQQLNDTVMQLHNRSSAGFSEVHEAQQKGDLVRTAWEREVRDVLSKTNPVVDNQNSHMDLVCDIASQLRELCDAYTQMRRERTERIVSQAAQDTDLASVQDEFAKQFVALLGRYDEIATALATVETKRRHLDNEMEDQRLAKASMDQEWREMSQKMERVQSLAQVVKKEGAVLQAAERRLGLGSRHVHGEAGRSSEFSTLLRLPDDSSTVTTTSHNQNLPLVQTTTTTNSITTPSPDTEDS